MTNHYPIPRGIQPGRETEGTAAHICRQFGVAHRDTFSMLRETRKSLAIPITLTSFEILRRWLTIGAAGGSYFFTVNLAERRLRLLTDHIDLLRAAFRYVRARHPFAVDAIVVLPDHLHAIVSLPEGDADYPLRLRLIKTHFSRNGCGTGPTRRFTGSRDLGFIRLTGRIAPKTLEVLSVNHHDGYRCAQPILQCADGLGLEKQPEKTFIGRIERGFDFLGYHLRPEGLRVAQATLDKFIARATRLYEQGPGGSTPRHKNANALNMQSWNLHDV